METTYWLTLAVLTVIIIFGAAVMHIEVTKVPPNHLVSVALGCKFKGRYDVTAENFVEEFDAEEELRAWLQYCNMIPLLIERVIADLKVHGICILSFKGIVIRDTEWRNPVASINWSNLKLPKLN